MILKCANCYEYKEERSFPKRTGGGYQSYCISCKRLLDRQYRRAMREKKPALIIYDEISFK